MSNNGWPEPLDEIIEAFQESSEPERLELLLEFAMSLPDLPPELATHRDQMEQVHE
nr:cysteine desulfuration protein SufE [Ardenticatenales bacterium]